MINPEIKNRLIKAVKNPLPGLKSHKKMMPDNRIGNAKNNRPPHKSAVLLLLFPDKTDLKLIFIKRTQNESIHSGQTAFPGGKFEKTDINLKNTALREAKEEINVNPDKITVIKELTPLYIPVSNFNVHPFVGISETKPRLKASKNEVDRIFTAKLSKLFEIKPVSKIINVRNNIINAPFFIFDEFEVWGASAMILNEFIDLTKPEFLK
ncbi:MAG: CoA pyrophosphatase [Chlorobi bacterium]|nr:CoA pyrophosphatase [Chlorobiota bacterium]